MTTPTSEMANNWHSTTVEQRLASAAAVLRRLPGAMPRTKLTSWPEVIHSTREAYGWNASQPRPIPPHPQDIQAMDQALEWLFWLTEGERKLVWARACRLPWRGLAEMDGRSHVTLRKVVQQAYQHIAHQLNKQGR
ncbi:MAG: hypothetical protein INF41_01005 [Rhodospirillaceae bacterium]|jgi:hypothetical protein|nr:hypothetical protein [Rhodospirillaceae bacterium]